MKKVSIIVAVVLVLSILLCACGGANKLVGTWNGQQDGVSMTISFNGDGTGTLTAMIISVPFTYTTEDGILKLVPDEDMEDIVDFTELPYEINGDILILGEGDEAFEMTRSE